MSRFNKKGFTTIMARTKENEQPHPVAVPAGSYHDNRQQEHLKKFKKAQKQAFREYKAKLREQKKQVPLAERAKINWSRTREKYL